MTSEEHLLMTYENHISFKAQVTNRNEPKVRYQAMVLIAAGILPLAAIPIYGGHIIGAMRLIIAGILPLAAIPINGGATISVLIFSLWLGICMVTLQWLQVRMVKNVHPELYISPLRWDRQGFITIQRRLLKAYFKDRNIGKKGRAELKRMVEMGREQKYPIVISVFATLFAGLWGSCYQIVSAHAKGDIKKENAVLAVFILLSLALGILAYYSIRLMEMTMSKKIIRSQVTDLLSESVIRSGK